MSFKDNCSEFNDEELVRKSLQDVQYFACLFERYEKKLARYILRISAFSKEETDDILQEAFLKIWKNLNKFDNSFKFSSWAYRIVHNTVVSEWKKSKSYGKDKQIKIDEDSFENLSLGSDFLEDLQKKDSYREIEKALKALPRKYQDVLVLKFLEEKSYNEISDILKKPLGTIATLVHRAKKAFREEADKNNISFELE
jgi:RNA polymerase sigma-70 factor, ECF subfamily